MTEDLKHFRAPRRMATVLTFLAGAGTYFLLALFMDWIDRRGEQQVAQACVKQWESGEWTPVTCAKERQEESR